MNTDVTSVAYNIEMMALGMTDTITTATRMACVWIALKLMRVAGYEVDAIVTMDDVPLDHQQYVNDWMSGIEQRIVAEIEEEIANN